MVARQGEVLQRLGKMSELFDDFSPLQLQTSGRWQDKAFTLVGRLQYQYGDGHWTEWHAVFDDGSSAFLSEDNGAYVMATPLTLAQALPPAAQFTVGRSVKLGERRYTVSSSQPVSLSSAQGELPRMPPLGQPFASVELRSESEGQIGRDEAVLSIEYSTEPPSCALGRPVRLEDLQLSNLREGSTKDEKGRAFNCPNCGATLTPRLADSKSMACESCHSLIDLSQGLGGELRHATQDEPVQPLIALGTEGTLQGLRWQVVGFQHRIGRDPSDPDETFGWEEYLLYNQQRGFCFLVDASDGWSLVQPVTGSPTLATDGRSASYLGSRYALKENYQAETTYVCGEFYWRVERGQRTDNRDFASGASILSLEKTPSEQTWSLGRRMDSAAVAQAFNLQDKAALLTRADATPFGAGRKFGFVTVLIIVLVLIVLVLLLSRCSSCNPAVEYCSSGSTSARSSGGSWGGSGGGGGHK